MTLGLQRTYQELRWAEDMDPNGAETASDLESLEQDVQHIIEEVIGSNLADPDKGVGAVNYLSGTTAQLQAMPSIIDSQLEKVSRITNSASSITIPDDGSDPTISVQVAVGSNVVNLQFALGPTGLTRV